MVQALGPEAVPVVGKLVQSIKHVEGIVLSMGPVLGAHVEAMAEVVDGFLAFALAGGR